MIASIKSIYVTVSYGKTIFALLLMCGYPLAAGFCLLERTAHAEVINCCPEKSSPQKHSPQPACDGQGCCPSKLAIYNSHHEDSCDFAAPAKETFSKIAFRHQDRLTVPATSPHEWPPPEISVSWHFSTRAAAPPRAPDCPA